MKSIRRLVVFVAATLVLVSCEPVEKRNEMKGKVTDAEITQYIKIEQQMREGQRSNFFRFSSDGLKANVQFKHGLGTVTVSSMGFIQCFVVAGEQEIVVNILNPDASTTSKTYSYTVDEAFDVAPEWALFCGDGSKTWVWDVDGADENGVNIHGMGDVFDAGGTWWGIPDPESRVAGEGVGATLTFSAVGSALTKIRTDGSKEAGQFSFSMYEKPKEGFSITHGQLSTVEATILAARNTKGGEVENKFEIIELTENTMHLLVVDMDGRDSYKPDNEGWGQATHWLFKAVE